MKTQDQVRASIERFRSGFWKRERIDHPPVGVVPARTWLPIGYLKVPFTRTHVTPADLTPALVRSDYEDAAIDRAVFSDDWLPYSAAWRAVPWLEAICGCPVRYATGSLAPEPCAGSPEELAEVSPPVDLGWYDCLADQTAALLRDVAVDCFVCPTILRGPSDVLAAMRGLTNFYLDLTDNPKAVARAATRVNRLLIEVLDRHFAAVHPKLGGYGNIYGHWAAGQSYVVQEDVLGMAAPRVYRDLFMQLNAEVVRRLGPHTLFHLHSSGMRHYKHVLNVPGLAGLEITVEAVGPTLSDLAPVLREILERSRLILFVDEHFDQLPEVLRQIPQDGLYLILSDKFVCNEGEYRAFLAEHWRRSL
jgi:hypothetical protein